MNMRLLLLLSLVTIISDAASALGCSKKTDLEHVRTAAAPFGQQARVAAQSGSAEVEALHLLLALLTVAVLCDTCQAEQYSSVLPGQRTDNLRAYLDGLQTPTRPTSHL